MKAETLDDIIKNLGGEDYITLKKESKSHKK